MTQTSVSVRAFTDWSFSTFIRHRFPPIRTVKPLFKTFVAAASLIAILLGASANARVLDNSVGAGTIISNRAEATYEDEAGESFSTVSPTITVTISAVATLAVTPDETAPSDTVAPRERVTRVFRVCNTGNNADTFTPTRFEVTAPATLTSLYFDNDNSGTLTDGDAPVRVNESISPQLAPGGCIGVLAVIDTNDAPAHSTLAITLAARSNALNAVNGRGQDAGTIINTVGTGPRLTDPDNSNLPPVSLINGKAQAVIDIGATVTTSIAFKNSGDTAARSVVITQELRDGIEYLSDSLQISARKESATISSAQPAKGSQNIIVNLPRIDPGEVVRLSFRLRITGNFSGGTGLVSGAVITGDNLAPVKTGTAIIVVNPFGFVFAGRAGSSAPIAGARLEIISDQTSENFVHLPADAGFTPNEKNENPFASDGQGHFSFALSPGEIGNENTTAKYFMKVTAQGYITRMMELNLRPTQAGLFSLTVHATDSQPLAVAGGFDLVREDVRINDLAALVLNVPMFEPAGLQIVKSADRARAEIGDTVTYRVEVHNPTAANLDSVVVKDTLPASFHYANRSALLSVGSASEQSIEPEIQGNELLFRIKEILHGATARLLYRVRVGANAREGDQENLAVASATFPSGEQIQSAQARATVFVSAGVFSSRQVLVGRVFVDTNGNGQFDEGDRPVPGARLYLSNGQSVITDSAGLYNFPSLSDGPQVISLDPVSLPKHYALTDGGRVSGKSWARLLRTPIGGGAMLRQNFALVDTHKLPPAKNQKDEALMTRPADNSSPAATPKPVSDSGTKPRQITTPGTYEMAATETVAAIAPGDVRILSPAPNSVSMSAALQTEVRVTLNWAAKVEINGEQVSDKNIGVRSLDHKNQVSTFTFVGLNLKPGPNRLRCTAISPDGAAGHSDEIIVIGRGPARRLQIVSEKAEIQSGGTDSTIVHIKAFDQWGNPALDGQVGIETSLGQLMRATDNPDRPNAQTPTPSTLSSDLNKPLGDQLKQQSNQIGSQLVVQLEAGEALLRLTSSGTAGEARLHAETSEVKADEQVRITSEVRPTILVGFAEMSFGKSIPEVALRDEQGKFRRRLSFFYSGQIPGNNMLTLSYDTQRPINRTAGADRIFQLDPLDRVYPLFGDSSTRYEAAQSNSKLYARVDHKRSYAMFGDFEADMTAPLAGYARKLTGLKAHLENSQGDFVTVTGARPDTAFARDVFPAGALGILQLSSGEILPGSETVVLEIRDRRNPEVIISHETLARSVDYNLDAITGRMFFMRYISTFDSALNLTQLIVTYEHRAAGLNSGVYTGRARKNFKGLGLKLGFSAVLQRQADQGNFLLGGFDAEKTLPRGGSLQLAWAGSQGEIMGSGNAFGSDDSKHDGTAYQLTLAQPLPFYGSTVKARYLNASAGFFNPFGGTVTPGSRRGEVTLEMKPRASSTLHFGFTSESNHTVNVDNNRLTYSAAWDQILNERIKFHLGFDHRAFTDDLNDKQTDSNLVTAGADIQLTDKLQMSVKREQNLGEADPTYPTQTTLGATYQMSALTKIFFSQRLASAPITPIGDYSGTGFAAVSSRHETALGIETRFGKYTSMTGRYQLENGINGTDSFAVIGLQDRLPLTKELSLEFGLERGFHLTGPNKSFDSAALGFGWQPNSDFRASARYEYRDRGGVGQVLAFGAAGKLREGITALSRIQWSRGAFGGKSNSALEGSAALAIRPIESDRVGLLFSYTHHSLTQDATSVTPTRDRSDSLSADGYDQLTKRLEIYGRFALRFSANGQPQLPYVSTLTFLTQARAQYLLTRRLDWAVETRLLFQPSSSTVRSVYATEVGFWVLPDMRLGVGYNFNAAKEPAGGVLPTRRGFYFTISSKLSNLFDLFGTSKAGLAPSSNDQDKNKE